VDARGRLVVWFLLVSTVPMLTMMATYVSFLTRGLEQAVAKRLTAAKTASRSRFDNTNNSSKEILRHASRPVTAFCRSGGP
jgi:hypothetical protein